MSRTAEEQGRRLLWLFPAWVRADRGEEALGVVLDQLPAHATRLRLGSRADLVRAGLHARRRWTPPPAVWIEVLLTEARNRRGLVPDAWRPWLVSWLRSDAWRRRYTAATAAAVVVLVMALWPAMNAGDSFANKVVNAMAWALGIGVMQYIRAPRWRSLVALRNGFVPSDLRSLPPDSTKVGLVRPLVGNRPALPVVVAALLGSAGLLAANLVVSAVDTGRGASSWGQLLVTALQLAAVFGLVVIPSVRRVRRLAGDRPAPPDPASMVERAQNRRARLGWILAGAFFGGIIAAKAVAGGVAGTLLLGGLLLAAVLQFGAVRWRQRRLGRPIGLWEAWSFTGPQPFLLVRQDVLEAKGLRSVETRPAPPSGTVA